MPSVLYPIFMIVSIIYVVGWFTTYFNMVETNLMRLAHKYKADVYEFEILHYNAWRGHRLLGDIMIAALGAYIVGMFILDASK